MSLARDHFAAQDIPLPTPIIDGGGPSSTFTGAVFGGLLLGLPAWGAHVAVRIPDGAFELAPDPERPRLLGPHLGVFRQVFFSLPVRLVAPRDPETLVRGLMGEITRHLLGRPEEVLFRAYQWNANSTRMAGEAKEVNLSSGRLLGMEICQLNRIEQAGGVKLAEPSYLIVIGADRLAYALSLQEYYEQGAKPASVAEFYRLAAEPAQALERLHHGLLFADGPRPGLVEDLEQTLSGLEQRLAASAPPTEQTLAEFRQANIVLESLFMVRAISGGLRQSYIGRIGDLAKGIARGFLDFPEEGRRLAASCQVDNLEAIVMRSEQLLTQGAANVAAYLGPVLNGTIPEAPVPPEVVGWHAANVTRGIDQDLLHRLDENQQSRLTDWVRANHAAIGPAARAQTADLPFGFAAVRVAEERAILLRDLAMGEPEVCARLLDIRLSGGSGAQRQQRLQRLFAVLEDQGVAIPETVRAFIPYMGIEQVFFSSRVFEREVPVLVDAWFDRHVPALRGVHAALSRNEPPEDAAGRHCWAATKLETAARYLMLRAKAGKPLWEDPYGARHILNRLLLPLWRQIAAPQTLRLALLECAVEGLEATPEQVERVRQYLLKKLTAAD